MQRFVAVILLAGSATTATQPRTAPLAACPLQPDPRPEVPLAAYGGMGDCMEYASESTCLKQTWGGDDFGN
jgi:hypothetical protein